MFYNEDRQRLHEGRHDSDAAVNTALITADLDYRAAISKSRSTLGSLLVTFLRELEGVVRC